MTYKTEFGDYDEMYGGIDYEDAIVLDIGADYGTTAKYFLERGARHIYCSERNEEWRAQLIEWAKVRQDVAVLPAMNAPRMILWLKDCRPDVVKVDCEGCEKHLIDVPALSMVIPRAWVIETHSTPAWIVLLGRFRLLGYRITKIHEPTPMENNPDKVVGLFQAVRDE